MGKSEGVAGKVDSLFDFLVAHLGLTLPTTNGFLSSWYR